MQPRRLTLALCLILEFMVVIRVFADEADGFTRGLAEYKEGNYLKAAAHFFSCCTSSPKDYRAHYYLANSYVHLERMPDALREYQAVIRLSPRSDLAKYSAQAIASFPVNFTNQRVNPLPRNKQSSTSGPLTLKEQGEQVVRTVNAQTDATEKFAQSEANAKVKNILREAADQARAVEQEKQEQVSANQAAKRRGYTIDNSSLDAEYQARIDKINALSKKRVDAVNERV